MANFKYMDLGKAMSDAAALSLADLKLNKFQREQRKQAKLQDIMGESTVPTLEPAEYDRMPGEEPIGGLYDVGQKFSPEEYQRNLIDEGMIEEAAEVSSKLSEMDEAQRETVKYNAEQVGLAAQFVLSLPEQYREEAYQLAIEDLQSKGIDTSRIPEEYNPIEVQKALAMADMLPKMAEGGSEFERLIDDLQQSETISSEKAEELKRKRAGVLSGEQARPSASPYTKVDVEGQTWVFDKTTGEYYRPQDVQRTGAQRRHEEDLSDKQTAREEKRIKTYQDRASEGMEHFKNMNTKIEDAIAAFESGNNKLADTLMAQVLSQVQDTNVRAYQMYQQFDQSYGNIAERIKNSIERFLTGSRPEEERQEIINTLKKFKETRAEPGIKGVIRQQRALARDQGLDPFKVVPPQSPEDIRDEPNVSKERKIELLKEYYPEMF